jgi:hypothetical protein
VSEFVSRRVQQRFDLQLPVTIEHQGQLHSGTTRNISLGGMFIDLPARIPLGDPVLVRFTIPRLTDPVQTQGHVRWVDGQSGLGIQFAGLRAREVWALQQLFQSAKPSD